MMDTKEHFDLLLVSGEIDIDEYLDCMEDYDYEL